jgi:hypothetical protein
LPSPIFIDDDENTDWLHQKNLVFVIYKQGKRVGTIDLKRETINSKDQRLQEIFYLLLDEGAGSGPISQYDPGAFVAAMEAQHYEAAPETDTSTIAKDAREDPAVIKNINFQGLRVAVENLRGDVRHGATFHQKMTVPYGYIQRTEGVDGDAVDCFLGALLDSPWVYVIHSRNKWGEYDEDKVMLGFESEDTARQCFLDNYDHPEFFGGIEKFTMTDFKYKLQALKGKKITDVSQKTSSAL